MHKQTWLMSLVVQCPCWSYKDSGMSEKQTARAAFNTFNTMISSLGRTYLRKHCWQVSLCSSCSCWVQMFAFAPLQSEKSGKVFWFAGGQSCVSTAAPARWQRTSLAPEGKEKWLQLQLSDCQSQFCCTFQSAAETFLSLSGASVSLQMIQCRPVPSQLPCTSAGQLDHPFSIP